MPLTLKMVAAPAVGPSSSETLRTSPTDALHNTTATSPTRVLAAAEAGGMTPFNAGGPRSSPLLRLDAGQPDVLAPALLVLVDEGLELVAGDRRIGHEALLRERAL